MLDKGPSRLGVLKRDRPKIAVGVGELIGLTFDPDESLGLDWSIGVVRWPNVTNVGQYHTGIQLLSRSAQSVKIRPADARVDSPGQPALALPRFGGDKSNTLLPPEGEFVKAAQFSVQADTGLVSVRASALVESADTYDRFTYELI